MEYTCVFSLDEIKAIRFRCQKCRASTCFQLNESITFPAICSGCRTTLYDSTRDTGDGELLHAFPNVLKSLVGLQGRKKSFEILLEIDAPRGQ